jgi:hypothetical protein
MRNMVFLTEGIGIRDEAGSPMEGFTRPSVEIIMRSIYQSKNNTYESFKQNL